MNQRALMDLCVIAADWF